jgi:hypothetical protein
MEKKNVIEIAAIFLAVSLILLFFSSPSTFGAHYTVIHSFTVTANTAETMTYKLYTSIPDVSIISNSTPVSSSELNYFDYISQPHQYKNNFLFGIIQATGWNNPATILAPTFQYYNYTNTLTSEPSKTLYFAAENGFYYHIDYLNNTFPLSSYDNNHSSTYFDFNAIADDANGYEYVTMISSNLTFQNVLNTSGTVFNPSSEAITFSLQKNQTFILLGDYASSSPVPSGFTCANFFNTTLQNGGSGTIPYKGYVCQASATGTYTWSLGGTPLGYNSSTNNLVVFLVAKLPPLPSITFNANLVYSCSNGRVVRQPFAPSNVSLISPAPAQYNLSISENTVKYSEAAPINFTGAAGAAAEWGLETYSSGVNSIPQSPFKNLYSGLQFALPEENATTSTYSCALGVPFCNLILYFQGSTKTTVEHYYQFFNAYNFTNWDSADLIGYNGVNYTVPLTDIFLSGYVPSYQHLYTAFYRIPNDNNTVTSSIPVQTNLRVAVPINIFPQSLNNITINSLELNTFYYSNTTRIGWTTFNGQALKNDTINKINVTNATKALALTFYDGTTYLQINVTANLNGIFNTSKRLGNYTYSTTSILPVNMSLTYTYGNQTFVATLKKAPASGTTYGLFNFYSKNPNIMSNFNNIKLNYSFNGSAYHAIDGDTVNFIANESKVINAQFTIKLTNPQGYVSTWTTFSVLNINGVNYSAVNNYITAPLPSASSYTAKLWLQNLTTGKYFEATNSKGTAYIFSFSTPPYDYCNPQNTLEYTFSYSLATKTSNITSNISSSSTVTAPPPPTKGAGFLSPINTVLGASLLNLGSFSWIVTPTMLYLIVLFVLALLILAYLGTKAMTIIELLLASLISIGYVVGIVNIIVFIPFVILLTYEMLHIVRVVLSGELPVKDVIYTSRDVR